MRRLTLIIILSVYFLNCNNITYYKTNAKSISFFHADNNGRIFKNFKKLNSYLNDHNRSLKFAMNGGMYLKDYSPQGLYIENGKVIKTISRVKDAYGNFYMQPNGVFYIDNNSSANVVTTQSIVNFKNIKYATQSGPMLVINGKINSKFNPNSTSYYVRNGVGILKNGKILFAISKKPIKFYDFAKFFKDKGCKNALYLDGFVSRLYLPSKNITNQDGIFGIIIAQTE